MQNDLQFIEHHYMLISLVWFPAALKYLDAIISACRVAGFVKAANGLSRIELFFKTLLSSLNNQGGSNVQSNPSSPTDVGTPSTK